MRSGFAISCLGHMAILTVGLIFAGANPFDPAPTDAIMVDIVSPNEVEAEVKKTTAALAGAPEAPPAPVPATPAPPPPPPPPPQSTPQSSVAPNPPATREAVAPTPAVPSPPASIPWLLAPLEPPPPAQPREANAADVSEVPLT